MTDKSAELDDLISRALAAPGLDRIDFRDPIAKHGDAAIVAMSKYLTDRTYGAFAVRTIAAAAAHGTTTLAIDTLTKALPTVEGAAVQRDILREVAGLRSANRPPTEVLTTPTGATIAGSPKSVEEYQPPLSTGESELLAVMAAKLPDGWTVFVRPHLDGDRPSLALLHRERGAMIWDVREVDLTSIHGSPRAYLDRDGAPYLDPSNRQRCTDASLQGIPAGMGGSDRRESRSLRHRSCGRLFPDRRAFGPRPTKPSRPA